TKANAEGEYNFTFKQKDATGLYRYSVSSNKGYTEDGSFVFVSKADRNAIVDALNGATEGSIPGICGTYKFELEIGDNIFAKADQMTAAKIIAKCIEENPFDKEDFRTVSDTVKTAYQIGAIAAGKITDLNEIKDVYSVVDTKISDWMSSDKISGLRKNQIVSALNGSYSSFNEFSRRFADTIVLFVVEQPNGMDNLKQVIRDFTDISASSLTNKACDAILGKKFASIQAIKDALSAVPSETGTGGAISGGGGGGGNNSTPPVSISPSMVITPTPKSPVMKFEDIDSVSWAYESIASLAKDGVISGRSESVFDPMGNVTREEFGKMLVCVLKLDIVSYNGEYTDVTNGEWYSDYIATAIANNICQGIGGNNFGVGLPITRQDMCVMIYNAIKGYAGVKSEENSFIDGASISDYAKMAVSSLAEIDLVHGTDTKEFLPKNNTTRAEAAVLLNALKNYLERGNN
ncbi:MAG: S-layer homology domain-containing protein, partial [Clostridia bacterium]|nr:S-layer homology domain-containing protein [Clostridia bacterium]